MGGGALLCGLYKPAPNLRVGLGLTVCVCVCVDDYSGNSAPPQRPGYNGSVPGLLSIHNPFFLVCILDHIRLNSNQPLFSRIVFLSV